MTITRETLELVALAIGGTLSLGTAKKRTGATWTEWEWQGPIGITVGGIVTHPQIDIGDAARLAVQLGILVTPPKHKGDGSSAEPTRGNTASCTAFRADPIEQTCIAITLCAAEIGRKMKEGNHGTA